MGAKVTWTENSVTVTGPPRDSSGRKVLQGIDINMNKMPDVAMTLAVVALSPSLKSIKKNQLPLKSSPWTGHASDDKNLVISFSDDDSGSSDFEKGTAFNLERTVKRPNSSLECSNKLQLPRNSRSLQKEVPKNLPSSCTSRLSPGLITALHYVASGGSVNVVDAVRLLITAGAHVSCVDADDNLPFDVIVVPPKLQRIKAVLEELLLDNGSDNGFVGKFLGPVSVDASSLGSFESQMPCLALILSNPMLRNRMPGHTCKLLTNLHC
ncbi:hypothetical protein KIW84_053291 [Lathyrus oleraceus]|uniref:Enolpyruvate transferase domain-containing protein n=1 Tax=Pisum sativum TaxID=3888 RepID=A0A9D4WR55_PEA|nr:hypothetical protein KIW84_053291 [Pisum sativum]